MATLVIQRALKRNLQKMQARARMYDAVLDAQHYSRYGDRATTLSGQSPTYDRDIFGRAMHRRRELPWDRRWNGDDFNSTGRSGEVKGIGASLAGGFGGLHAVGFPRQALGYTPRCEGGRYGSIGLPPDSEESRWIMHRFLKDLRKKIDLDEGKQPETLERRGKDSFAQQREALEEKTSCGQLDAGLRRVSTTGSKFSSFGIYGRPEGLAYLAKTKSELGGDEHDRRIPRLITGCDKDAASSGGCRIDSHSDEDPDTTTGKGDQLDSTARHHDGQGRQGAPVVGWLRSFFSHTWGGRDDSCHAAGSGETASAPEGVDAVVASEGTLHRPVDSSDHEGWERNVVCSSSLSGVDEKDSLGGEFSEEIDRQGTSPSLWLSDCDDSHSLWPSDCDDNP